jgi:hypothetical protein
VDHDPAGLVSIRDGPDRFALNIVRHLTFVLPQSSFVSIRIIFTLLLVLLISQFFGIVLPFFPISTLLFCLLLLSVQLCPASISIDLVC